LPGRTEFNRESSE